MAKSVAERFSDECTEFCNRMRDRYGVTAIQMIATWDNHDGSSISAIGKGNFYARRGMAAAWLESQSEIPVSAKGDED